MRRLLVLFAIMVFIFVPAMTSAHEGGHSLPPSATEQEAWELVDTNNDRVLDTWVTMYVRGSNNTLVPSAEAKARAWTSDPIPTRECNTRLWPLDVAVHASVAQWISWNISATRWDWRVRKPGTYCTDCVTFVIHSNNSVRVDYEGFADLAYEGDVVEGTLGAIATFYTMSNTGSPPVGGWVAAESLNTPHFDLIPNTGTLHHGETFKLWNKIVVDPCNSSCEYHDDAKITLSLTNMKAWIDENTGFFKEKQLANPPHPTPPAS
ncbi:MAG: hypothetical protein ACOYES_07500 [Bacillota bacterium]|jgi:hypothetical protein